LQMYLRRSPKPGPLAAPLASRTNPYQGARRRTGRVRQLLQRDQSRENVNRSDRRANRRSLLIRRSMEFVWTAACVLHPNVMSRLLPSGAAVKASRTRLSGNGTMFQKQWDSRMATDVMTLHAAGFQKFPANRSITSLPIGCDDRKADVGCWHFSGLGPMSDLSPLGVQRRTSPQA
jgi:hypothetical protein